jgi:HlyD family secretion protein
MQAEHVSNPKKKKKWIVAGLIASIVLIAGVNIAVIQNKAKSSADELKFVTAKEKELSTTKLISGTVTAGKEESFYADPSLGKVKEIFVQEGQTVQPGQELFSYDNPELSFQLKQLEIDKKMTNLRYEQTKSQIDSLKNEIENAKKDGSPKEVITPLEKQLKELEMQQQTTELEMEKNRLQGEQLKLKQNEMVVTSSIAGVVQKVDANAGKSSGQSSGINATPVVQIASQEPFQIEGTLSELQKALIQPEQPITVTAKALSGKKWTGKITWVSQYPTSDETGKLQAAAAGQASQNISYYHFKAALDSQDGLAPGYHVSIQVNLDTKKLLVIPRTCIVEKGDSKYVFVVKDGKLDKRKITTGIGDGESVEVVKGVRSGEKLVDDPSADLFDGMEVKGK